MKDALNSGQYETEMLRFIRPVNNTIELMSTPYGHISQRYIINSSTPVMIMMWEENTIWQDSVLLYIFSIQGRDLMLNSCTERVDGEEVIIYENGYAYIRLPETYNEPVTWNYQFCENISVSCTATLNMKEIDGVECDTLHVERVMEYTENTISEKLLTNEYYVAGKGIQSKVC